MIGDRSDDTKWTFLILTFWLEDIYIWAIDALSRFLHVL